MIIHTRVNDAIPPTIKFLPIMNNAIKRSILRWTHLILSIPILGYIYGEPSQVQQYAAAARFIFVPAIVLSGFWMYSGVFFAIIGVAVWLGAYRLSGVGAAILSQVALFIARKTWLVIRARKSKQSLSFGTPVQ